jgi:hypothetical protein
MAFSRNTESDLFSVGENHSAHTLHKGSQSNDSNGSAKGVLKNKKNSFGEY